MGVIVRLADVLVDAIQGSAVIRHGIRCHSAHGNLGPKSEATRMMGLPSFVCFSITYKGG